MPEQELQQAARRMLLQKPLQMNGSPCQHSARKVHQSQPDAQMEQDLR